MKRLLSVSLALVAYGSLAAMEAEVDPVEPAPVEVGEDVVPAADADADADGGAAVPDAEVAPAPVVLGEDDVPEPEPVVGEDGLTPDQRSFWERFTGENDIDIDGIRAQARALYLQALALFQKGEFVEAQTVIARSLTIDPTNAEARALQDNIGGILGNRGNSLQMFATWMRGLQDVSTQEQAVQMANLLNRGDEQLRAGAYREAFLAYDRVAIGIRSFPYTFDWGELPAQIEAKKVQALGMAREADLAAAREARSRADLEARRRSAMEEEALRLKVDEMLRRAHESFRRRHYERAALDAWHAYELDRRREDARSLYLEARKRGHVQFDRHHEQERKERLARVHENIHAALIPQSELLVYPEDWFRRSLRTATEISENTEEPWRRELNNRLEQEVTFVFEERAVDEIVDFLRRTTGVNFVLDRNVIADTSIPPISLSGTMKLRTVLGWITRMTRLNVSLRSEVVYISAEAVTGDVVTRLYNVGDLISPVQDFEGPDLAFTTAGGGGGGGFDLFGGGGAGGGNEDQMDVEGVREFLENAVIAEWGENRVIEASFGQHTIFVSHVPEVHEQIEALLTNLRNQRSLQVNIQIRVLDVRKSFREEIGVEWSDLGNDLLTGSTTRNGVNVRRPEWDFGGSSDNSGLPSNQSSTGFSNIPGDGMRGEWSYNMGALLNRPQLNATLEAIQKETDAQILNAPQITCFSGQRANATFIRQYAYISDYDVAGSGNYDPVISVVNYGDIIDVKPFVSADRKYVTLEVRPSSVLLQDVFVERIQTFAVINDVIDIVSYPIELPNLEVRMMRSTVTIPDKGSLMIGGYTRGLRERTHTGIPFLSHIPFLGRLFGKNGIYDESRRLFFLLSVEIIDLQEREELR